MPEVVTEPKTGPKGVSLITEMIRRQIQADPKATADGPAPVTPVAPKVEPAKEPAKVEVVKPVTEPVKPADDGKPRNTDGTFKEDPNKAAMREVIKRQQDRIKALEAKPVTTATAEPQKNPREDALIASMSKETREWYEKGGKELMGLQAQSALAPHEKALAKADAMLREEEADAKWNNEFNDWMAGKYADGEVVDERAYLTTLKSIDEAGWVLGKTNAAHFDAVLAIMKSKNPNATAPIRIGKEAEEAARKEAEELARAGGVRPGGSSTPNPQADRSAELKALREGAMRGDGEVVRNHIRKRMSRMGIFPGEAPPEGG